MAFYQVQVSVKVTNQAELRAYALSKAIDSGISEEEFSAGEHAEATDNLEYWLGWCFDAGTPDACGFEIQDSGVVYEGGHELQPAANDKETSADT